MKSFVVLAAFLACAAAKPGLVGYNAFPYAAAPYNAFGYSGVPAFGYSAIASPAIAYNAPAIAYSAPAVVAPAFTKTQYHAQDELGQASYGHAHPGQAHAAVRDAAGNVRGSYAYVNPDGNEIRVNYIADAGGFRVESNALPQAPVHVVEPIAAPADTPEVVEARAAHFLAHAEAKARSSRKKRGLAYTYGAAPALAYSAAPALTYAAAPALTYAAHPALAPAYAAYSAPAVAYAAGPALREATLTKIVNTPGHAVSYRVD